MLEHILTAQHCQRNWANTPIPDDLVQDIVECGTSMPTKQSRHHYDVVCVSDARARTQINKWCVDGRTADVHRNPQAQAPLLLLWFKQYNELLNINGVGTPEHTAADISIGLSAGAVMIRANQLGLRTGCCVCISRQEIHTFLEQHTRDDYYREYHESGERKHKLCLIMGVGYPHADSISHKQQIVDGVLQFRGSPDHKRSPHIKYI